MLTVAGLYGQAAAFKVDVEGVCVCAGCREAWGESIRVLGLTLFFSPFKKNSATTLPMVPSLFSATQLPT